MQTQSQHNVLFHSYDILEMTPIETKFVTGCQMLRVEEKYKRIRSGGRAGDGNRIVPCLDCSYSYTNVCTCQNSQSFILERVNFIIHQFYLNLKKKNLMYINCLGKSRPFKFFS